MSAQGVWNFDHTELPYQAQLHKTALRLTRCADGAEDLLQDTYLKAYRYYATFRPGTNLKAWLFKILKNTYINEYRRRCNLPGLVSIADIEETLESAIASAPRSVTHTPEDELLEASVDDEVQRALAELPHAFRVVVLLADVEGHAYKEIAAILSVPIGTVMSRLFRGRRLLERALLSFGVRYNYLNRRPRRLRSSELDLDDLFGTGAAPAGPSQGAGQVVPA